MGNEESQAIIGTEQDWIRKQQKSKDFKDQLNKQKSFYKIQNCAYPHPLIQRQNEQMMDGHHKCTMKHNDCSSYNLCSKCQHHPQKIVKNRRLIYEKSDYKLKKPNYERYDNSDSKYVQKQVGAPGPQVPAFFNGFSLPVQRYYKHRSPIGDHHQHQSGSIYRDQHNKIEESIYEQISEKNPSRSRQIEIDWEGHQQNLHL